MVDEGITGEDKLAIIRINSRSKLLREKFQTEIQNAQALKLPWDNSDLGNRADLPSVVVNAVAYAWDAVDQDSQTKDISSIPSYVEDAAGYIFKIINSQNVVNITGKKTRAVFARSCALFLNTPEARLFDDDRKIDAGGKVVSMGTEYVAKFKTAFKPLGFEAHNHGSDAFPDYVVSDAPPPSGR